MVMPVERIVPLVKSSLGYSVKVEVMQLYNDAHILPKRIITVADTSVAPAANIAN